MEQSWRREQGLPIDGTDTTWGGVRDFGSRLAGDADALEAGLRASARPGPPAHSSEGVSCDSRVAEKAAKIKAMIAEEAMESLRFDRGQRSMHKLADLDETAETVVARYRLAAGAGWTNTDIDGDIDDDPWPRMVGPRRSFGRDARADISSVDRHDARFVAGALPDLDAAWDLKNLKYTHGNSVYTPRAWVPPPAPPSGSSGAVAASAQPDVAGKQQLNSNEHLDDLTDRTRRRQEQGRDKLKDVRRHEQHSQHSQQQIDRATRARLPTSPHVYSHEARERSPQVRFAPQHQTEELAYASKTPTRSSVNHEDPHAEFARSEPGERAKGAMSPRGFDIVSKLGAALGVSLDGLDTTADSLADGHTTEEGDPSKTRKTLQQNRIGDAAQTFRPYGPAQVHADAVLPRPTPCHSWNLRDELWVVPDHVSASVLLGRGGSNGDNNAREEFRNSDTSKAKSVGYSHPRAQPQIDPASKGKKKSPAAVPASHSRAAERLKDDAIQKWMQFSLGTDVSQRIDISGVWRLRSVGPGAPPDQFVVLRSEVPCKEGKLLVTGHHAVCSKRTFHLRGGVLTPIRISQSGSHDAATTSLSSTTARLTFTQVFTDGTELHWKGTWRIDDWREDAGKNRQSLAGRWWTAQGASSGPTGGFTGERYCGSNVDLLLGTACYTSTKNTAPSDSSSESELSLSLVDIHKVRSPMRMIHNSSAVDQRRVRAPRNRSHTKSTKKSSSKKTKAQHNTKLKANSRSKVDVAAVGNKNHTAADLSCMTTEQRNNRRIGRYFGVSLGGAQRCDEASALRMREHVIEKSDRSKHASTRSQKRSSGTLDTLDGYSSDESSIESLVHELTSTLNGQSKYPSPISPGWSPVGRSDETRNCRSQIARKVSDNKSSGTPEHRVGSSSHDKALGSKSDANRQLPVNTNLSDSSTSSSDVSSVENPRVEPDTYPDAAIRANFVPNQNDVSNESQLCAELTESTGEASSLWFEGMPLVQSSMNSELSDSDVQCQAGEFSVETSSPDNTVAKMSMDDDCKDDSRGRRPMLFTSPVASLWSPLDNCKGTSEKSKSKAASESTSASTIGDSHYNTVNASTASVSSTGNSLCSSVLQTLDAMKAELRDLNLAEHEGNQDQARKENDKCPIDTSAI
eukprot:SAG31_NODE_699_length_12741_cov_5.762617_14_plen_1138_part_00